MLAGERAAGGDSDDKFRRTTTPDRVVFEPERGIKVDLWSVLAPKSVAIEKNRAAGPNRVGLAESWRCVSCGEI